MDIDRLIRKIVHFEDEIHAEGERPVSPPLRRIAVGAVIKNPRLSGASEDAFDELVHVSERLGVDLTMRALERLGDPASIRSYSKAVVVGSAGDLEHGAAMIHSRLGMAIRQTIKRGRVLIPGNAKVGPAGTQVDVCFGPVDEGWDLDAMDTMSICVADAPRPEEILLVVAFASGPRPNARAKGPSQDDVDRLLAAAAR